MPVTRGFRGRERLDTQTRERVPPGQFVTSDFPVLTAGATQYADPANWTFSIKFAGKVLGHWNRNEFEALPQTEVRADIHCVTKWTKLGTRWRGVTIDDLLVAAGLVSPPTAFAMAHCDGDYTTNYEVRDLIEGRALLATHYEDLPISPSHGGPARMLLPHLYFWKSAKWVRRLDFVERNDPGFWESLGYHLRGDPWREQRYAGDE